MGVPKSEVIAAIYHLLPGFIAAWIFYGLTAHPQKSPFERTIQALIFTAFIQAIVIPLGWLLLLIGEEYGALGQWTDGSFFVTSVLVAASLGLLFSVAANTSKLHHWLPDWVTKRTSFPSEWYSAFNQDERYIYLHLRGGRRLYGWPYEWPDAPDKGHFVIYKPEWVLDDNTRAPLLLTLKLVLPVSEVEMVEFEKLPSEQDYDPVELKEAENILVKLQQAKAAERSSEKDREDGG